MSLEDKKRRVRYWNGKLVTRESKVRVDKHAEGIYFQKWKPNKKKSRTAELVWWSFLFSFLFFLVSGVILFVSLLDNRNNVISPDKVLVEFDIPSTTDYGKSTPASVRIFNTNAVSLNDLTITIPYPPGVQRTNNSKEKKYVKNVDTVGRDQEYNAEVSLVIKSGSDKPLVIPLSLEYSIPGSDARFTIQREKSVSIRGIPVEINFQSTGDISEGSPATVEMHIINKDPTTTHNIRVEMMYPSGFTVQSTTPTSYSGRSNTWDLRRMSPGETRVISVGGIFTSTRDVVLTMRATASLVVDDRYRVITTASTPITVNSAFMSASVSFKQSGGRSKNIASPNSFVRGIVRWQSLSSEVLRDVEIIARFSGNGINVQSLEVENRGLFDGNRQQVTWNKITNPEIKEISPNQKGDIDFGFKTLPAGIVEIETQHRYVSVDLILNGITGTGIRETISFPNIAQVQLATALSLLAETRYSSGKLKNTGPRNLEVDKETTLSLYFFIKNQGNILEDMTMTIPLIAQTKWKNVVVQNGERVEYDPDTHSIKWNIGQIEGLGSGSSRTLEVQVSVVPTILDEKDKTLPLTKDGRLSGIDSFTKQPISTYIQPLMTRLPRNELLFQ